jgi:peptidoglycan/LPS O-acetylase OafA/YrhL
MRRVAELDALRGIAAIMVLSLHLGLASQYAVLASAVDLFFVLSGYLITRIILDHETNRGFLLPFYVRRVLRIWPIYYTVLVGFLVVNPFLPYRQRTTAWPYFLTFTQFIPRYWFARPPYFCIYFRHTWTLAAEEQFYVLWPLIAVLLGRRMLLATIPVLVASAFVARLWLWPMLLVTNWDGFGLGALLAWMLGEPGSARARRPGVVVGLGALSAATLAYPFVRGTIESWLGAVGAGGWPTLAGSLNTSRMMLLYFSVVGLVISFAGHPLLRPLREKGLCYLGTISYGLYFYHGLLYVMISHLHYTTECTDSMALDAFKLAATFALAIISWECFEKRILRLKDRFPYPTPLPAALDCGAESNPRSIVRRPHMLAQPSAARSGPSRVSRNAGEPGI